MQVTVEIVNRNPVPLELADLELAYPRTSVLTQEMARERRSLGTIQSGTSVRQEFEITLFGEEGSLRSLEASLEYRIPNSNAIFVRTESIEVIIQSTPLELLINAPTTSLPNQRISFDVIVNAQSPTPLENMLVGVEYPATFTFEESVPPPSFGQNTWAFPFLDVGSETKITITGTLQGDTDSLQVFRAFVGNQNPRRDREILTVFNTAIHDIAVQSSFIDLALRLGNQSNTAFTLNSGQNGSFTLDWENRSGEILSNIEIVGVIGGNAYTAQTVAVQRGFFDSNTNRMIWDRTNDARLGSIGPSDRGSVTFSLAPRSLIAGNQTLAQPEITLDFSIRALDATGRMLTAERLVSQRVVINSDLQLQQRTLYYGGILSNSGPYPPVVGQRTDMTIVWNVTNSSNTIDEAVVTTTLPQYVTWNNRFSPASENITYNTVTREVRWSLGEIARGTGFETPAREVSFQVSLTPSVSQIGPQPVPLTSDVVIQGRDRFTNSLLQGNRREHTTQLLNDVQPGSGTITQ
ncbi:MAG: hypothetical protein LRY41_01020 [Candidatus Pacebacteria bacterium]|nr:hypothetical protein [Candidatus Paceibacterota bacterium]